MKVDQRIIEIRDYFKKYPGTLFHYTNNNEAIKSMECGTLHFTRADCFADDPNEIVYGRSILLEAALDHDEIDNKEENCWIINTLGELLLNCFVFCTTNQTRMPFMHEKFGSNVIEFIPNFSTFYYHCMWASKRMPGTDGYKLYHVPEIFDHLEGFVIYDAMEQRKIARSAVNLIHHLRKNPGATDIERAMTALELRRILACCMTLFKETRFKDEYEYRFCLVRNPNPEFADAPSFDVRGAGTGRLAGKERIYTEVTYRGIGKGDIKAHYPFD